MSVQERTTGNLELPMDVIFSHISDCIIVYDSNKRVVYANKSCSAGFKMHDLLLSEKWCQALGQVITSRQPVHGEIAFSNLSSISDCYEYYLSPVMNSNGNVELIVATTHNVTERKTNEEALIARNTRLEKALDCLPEAVFTSDTNGKLLDINATFMNAHKAKDKESCPKTFSEINSVIDVFNLDGTPATKEQWTISRALRGETGHNQEYMIRAKSTGQRSFHSFSFAPVRNADGVIVGSVHVGTDITDRKMMEVALRKSEEHYRKYFELGLVGMAIKSPVGEWIEVNDRLCEILGYSREELMTKHWKDLTHPDDMETDVEFYRQLQSGLINQYTIEKRYIHKDKKIVYCLLAIGCSRNEDGSISDVYMIIDDITAEKQNQEALIRAKEELIGAVREITSGGQSIKRAVNSFGNISSRHLETSKEASLESLTSKQRQILRLISAGNTSAEIASKLYLSKHTVDWHRSRIKKKLGTDTAQELLRYCFEAGLL